MSNTKNVKLGVCQVLFNGVDLGYTQGGVEVSVKTDTHKVSVDQFGKSTINEYIIGREVTVKVPLAETTLQNLATTMPGSQLIFTGGGTQATGTLTIATNPAAGTTVVINNVVMTFQNATGYTGASGQVLIGATAAATASNLQAALSAYTVSAPLMLASYTVAGAVITVTYQVTAAAGNAFTLSAGTAGVSVTLSGATLSGGVDGANEYAIVTSGVGSNLLSFAAPLRLHPISNAATNLSEDFVIPLAATAGAMTFTYSIDKERVFSCEFNGYPDPTTGKLFTIGN